MSTTPGKATGRRKGRDGALTTADLVVLGLLSERPLHGYQLMREYARQEVEDWASISRPHVYYALQKLARLGLIAGEAEQIGERDRVVYRMRPEGARALADALAQESWATAHVPAPFTTWMGLSIHARPEDVGRVLAARRKFLEAKVAVEQATLEAIRADEGARVGVAEAMVTLAIRQYQVELDWLAEMFPAGGA